MALTITEADCGDSHKTEFINCKASVKKVFSVANFDQMFTIV